MKTVPPRSIKPALLSSEGEILQRGKPSFGEKVFSNRASRKVFAGFLTGLVALGGHVGTVHGQTPGMSAQEVCPIDLGIAELLERCGVGAEIGPVCGLARVAGTLVNADDGAAIVAIQKVLDFDAAAAADLLPAFRFLGLLAVGPFEPLSACAYQASSSLMAFMQQAIAGLPVDTWLLLWPILGWDDALLPAVEAKVSPLRVDLLRTSRVGVEAYIAASTHAEAFAHTDQAQVLWNLIAGGLPGLLSDADSPKPPAEPESAQGEEEAPDNEGGGRDSSSTGSSRTPEALDALSAGVAALAAGRLEESARWLQKAEKQLDLQTESDPLTRARFRLARWLRVLAYKEMGQRDRAQQLRETLPADEDALDRILNLIGKAVLDEEGVTLQTAWAAILEHAQSGPRGAAEIEVLWEALSMTIPGISEIGLSRSNLEDSEVVMPAPAAGVQDVLRMPVPLGGAFPGMTTSMAAKLVKRDYEAAARQSLELLERFPRYENIGLLFLAIGEQWSSGNRERALANGLKGLDKMEDLVAEMEVEELRRSFIDEKASTVYQVVFGMAAQAGEAELAFEIAERGKAWDLRRRWGALLPVGRIWEHTEPSAAELDALQKLVAHETDGDSIEAQSKSAWLEKRSKLRNDFRHYRLERNLVRNAVGRDAESSEPLSLQPVSNPHLTQ